MSSGYVLLLPYSVSYVMAMLCTIAQGQQSPGALVKQGTVMATDHLSWL